MAAVLVLEPIFEADLQPEQYAYRQDRSALDAVKRVHQLIYAGHHEIVDADLSSYFDRIPHSELLQSVARRVVVGTKVGALRKGKGYIINYADDLVICRRAGADEALVLMRNMMSRLKMTVNENKTRVCRLPEEKLDFLGYTFGRCYSSKTGRAYWGTTPSKKRVQRLCKSISEMTRRSQTQQNAATLVAALNRQNREGYRLPGLTDSDRF
jgi:RNA-directed DNA polymerase